MRVRQEQRGFSHVITKEAIAQFAKPCARVENDAI
jgi:hypothetical protein